MLVLQDTWPEAWALLDFLPPLKIFVHVSMSSIAIGARQLKIHAPQGRWVPGVFVVVAAAVVGAATMVVLATVVVLIVVVVAAVVVAAAVVLVDPFL